MVVHTNARADREPLYVPIEALRLNPKKLRKLSTVKIRRYRHDYEAGDDFPPIKVLETGAFYTIRDGRHRYMAQLAGGFRFVAVEVMN